MCRPFSLCCLFLLALSPVVAQTRLACWNVENLFDTCDDVLTRDDAFTPRGENHWTWRRFVGKRDKIYKTLAAMGYPVAVGLVEVENDWVLDELCLGTPLRRLQYGYVHYDSPDPRGIDCALLFRRDRFRLLEQRPLGMSDSAAGYFTRDILLVGGRLPQGDTLDLLVNHWPSKLGGSQADSHRSRIALRLCSVMDSLHRVHPESWVVAMGDFNATPQEVQTMLQPCSGEAGLHNLMENLPDSCASYKYQGHWQFIDQILVCTPVSRRRPRVDAGVFMATWLLTDDSRYMGVKPFRTYQAMVYQGGVSDHLPVYLDFLCDE